MSTSQAPLRVVIGEDEPCSQRILQAILTQLGHTVGGVAPCGRDLVGLCRTLTPDLVLVDLKLPKVDCLDGASDLCGAHPVPVIVLSEYHAADLVERAGNCPNVMAYLVKPVTAANLGPAITVARRRFAQFRKLVDEAAALRQGMEERKVIE